MNNIFKRILKNKLLSLHLKLEQLFIEENIDEDPNTEIKNIYLCLHREILYNKKKVINIKQIYNY
jgi:hypothetical protein